MAPVSKDTLEVASSAVGIPAPQTSASSSSPISASRSEVVSLEIPVKVHGSRILDAKPGATPNTEPFEEQTQTMIVFPDGAVVKLNTAVGTGQMLVMTNLRTRQDAICRVRKVRPNPNLSNYVEVEFTHSQRGYWGISFPSDVMDKPTKTAPVAAPPAETKAPPPPAPEISWAPAPAPPAATPKVPEALTPAPPARPLKPEPNFIPIGTQEEVQPAASATATTKPGKISEAELEKLVLPAAKLDLPAEIPSAPPVNPPASVSLEELQGDPGATGPELFSAETVGGAEEPEVAPAKATAATPSSEKIFGRFVGGAAQAEETDAPLSLTGTAGESGAPPSGQNWMLIAAGIAVLAVALAGGVYYVRSHAKSSGPESRAAGTGGQAGPVAGAQTQGFLAAVQPNPASSTIANSGVSSRANVAPMNGATGVVAPSAPRVVSNTQPVSAQPAAVPTSKAVAPSVTPNMMSSALNAHPTSPARASDDSADEPTVTPHPGYAEANENALVNLPSSSNAASLPQPTIQPEGPVKAGGQVQEPKLIASALPVYPLTAKNSGIQGDVVIETTIDKDGNVAGMRVVSGPAILRQAALEALRKWKYEPSKLDGQPISVQVMVTIKFRK